MDNGNASRKVMRDNTPDKKKYYNQNDLKDAVIKGQTVANPAGNNEQLKEIKDYMHLYLGCMVENMPYLPTDSRKIQGLLVGVNNKYGTALIQNYSTSGEPWGDIFKYPIIGCKPALRPLSDMNNEEIRAYAAIGLSPRDGERKKRMVIEAEQTKYLLSKHFDLFGLIESGLAIDKTKVASCI